MRTLISQLLLIAGVTCAVFLSAVAPATTIQDKDQGSQTASVLGRGRGISVVGAAVRDLDAATKTYRDTLGFKIAPGAIHNAVVMFENFTTLELATSSDDRWEASRLADVLTKNEGAAFLHLQVSPAEHTAAFLRARGFEIDGPHSDRGEAKSESPLELYWTVEFKKPVVPGNTIAFVEHNFKALREWGQKHPTSDPTNYRDHPNTAKRIYSVWMAVKNLEAATKAYESIGLPAGRKVEVPHLGATGREIQAGRGVILLVQANDRKGKVAAFIAKRGEGVMGVSIELAKLETARQIIETNTKRRLAPYQGLYGQSILIPGELAHGAWIEMFQK